MQGVSRTGMQELTVHIVSGTPPRTVCQRGHCKQIQVETCPVAKDTRQQMFDWGKNYPKKRMMKTPKPTPIIWDILAGVAGL